MSDKIIQYHENVFNATMKLSIENISDNYAAKTPKISMGITCKYGLKICCVETNDINIPWKKTLPATNSDYQINLELTEQIK